MTNNTDPVRAQDELRVQAALLRTPEFMAQFDPGKFAGQLERIAAVIASAPPSAPVGVDAELVREFRDYVAENAPGLSHHHPIWVRIADALAQHPAAPSATTAVDFAAVAAILRHALRGWV